MRYSTLAALALTAAALPVAETQPTRGYASDSDHSARAWFEKQAPRYSSTPNKGFGQRIEKARNKAKAASKARKAQRMRAKGKRP